MNNMVFGATRRASSVAAYVINKAIKSETPITNLQLQKILYYIQGGFVAKYSCPLFYENMEAWQWGPVVPEVYYLYKGYSSSELPPQGNVTLGLSDEENLFLDSIIEKLSTFSGSALVHFTHLEDPWKQVTKDGQIAGPGRVLPLSMLYSFFSEGKSLLGNICNEQA